MNKLVRTGTFFLLVQVVLGTAIYLIPGGEEAGVGPSLLMAGLVAVVFMLVAMVVEDIISVALALASLGATGTVFGFLGGLTFLTISSLVSCFFVAYIAAAAARLKGLGGGKTKDELFLDALPIVGTSLYLLGLLGHESKKLIVLADKWKGKWAEWIGW